MKSEITSFLFSREGILLLSTIAGFLFHRSRKSRREEIIDLARTAARLFVQSVISKQVTEPNDVLATRGIESFKRMLAARGWELTPELEVIAHEVMLRALEEAGRHAMNDAGKSLHDAADAVLARMEAKAKADAARKQKTP